MKVHVSNLRMILDACQKHQISLNIKKCIFCVPFGILLGHIVFRQGMMVDPTKIAVIIKFPVPTMEKQLRSILGHTGYYKKFIQGYPLITAPMEKLLKKDVSFFWDDECQKSFELLKENMVSSPILIFPDWDKVFHVHIDASGISLGAILT